MPLIGNPISVYGYLRDEDGNLFNATSEARFIIRDPDGGEVVYVDTAPQVTNPSVGTYRYVNMTTLDTKFGTYHWRLVGLDGSANMEAADSGTFTVSPDVVETLGP